MIEVPETGSEKTVLRLQGSHQDCKERLLLGSPYAANIAERDRRGRRWRKSSGSVLDISVLVL